MPASVANGSSVANFNRLNEWPLQFLRTGYYLRSKGYIVNRTTEGHWWSDTADPATGGRYLASGTGNVYAQISTWRGNGLALRCGVRGNAWWEGSGCDIVNR